MARTKKYPGADTSKWFGRKYAGLVSDDLDKLLLHSTETDKRRGCPGYQDGSMAPTLTINPWPGYRKVYQHFDLNQSGRALANPASTPVSENKDRVCQIEIIGYSDKALGKARGCYLMDLDDDSLQWLANVLAFIMREWTIPNVWATPFPWPIYPASYGNSPSRMSSSEYDAFKGVLGHLHASGNSHGDPSLPVADLRARVGALLGSPTTNIQEDDMPDPRDLWAYEYKGRQALSYLVTADTNARAARADAAAALAIVRAQAEAGRPLTAEETKAIVDSSLDEKIDDAVTVLNVSPQATKETA